MVKSTVKILKVSLLKYRKTACIIIPVIDGNPMPLFQGMSRINFQSHGSRERLQTGKP